MIELYDTTLRDGNQAEGVAFSVEDKLLIVEELDQLGIRYIEGGYPASNPTDLEFFRQAKQLQLQHAEIIPFGSTRYPSYHATEDPGLLALLETETRTVTIFGKTWRLHATDVLQITPEENIELIESTVRFLVQNGREVLYDAEHFFDGYSDDPDYALKTLAAAALGGAKRLILCDTNGGRLPLEIEKAVQAVLAQIDLPIGIHTHDDMGMGVANAILAVQSGATHVQGTFNGYGERCGNANLSSIIPTLKLKLGIDCVTDAQLGRLSDVSRIISELANLPHDERQPFVGRSAFAHKGGLHTDAMRKNLMSYEHIQPELVGNERRILISNQAGRSAVLKKIERHYPNCDKNSRKVITLFNRLKEAERNGYQYEAADASFEILTHKVFGQYRPFFKLLGFRVIVEKLSDRSLHSEATIKISEPNGEEEHTASDGDGPVNALDAALRKALERIYPSLRDVHLVDYKVRVLETKRGTDAKVRVLIESSDGRDYWRTVGVSENILQASWEALAESLEYKLHKDRHNR